MNFNFEEVEADLTRHYSLIPSSVAKTFFTKRARIDICETKQFGPMFFIDGVLQASHFDEYIYHEFLVHPAMALTTSPKRVCIFGGGDGCAIREVLKWKSVERVDILDWDKELVDYFKQSGKLWNQGSLLDSRVQYEDVDIRSFFVTSEQRKYDVILIDLLDPVYADLVGPDNFWENLLLLAHRWMTPGGSIAINGGGILPWAYETYYTLFKQLRTHFDLSITPYKVFVPSYASEWGFFVLHSNALPNDPLPILTRRFTIKTFAHATHWELEFKSAAK